VWTFLFVGLKGLSIICSSPRVFLANVPFLSQIILAARMPTTTGWSRQPLVFFQISFPPFSSKGNRIAVFPNPSVEEEFLQIPRQNPNNSGSVSSSSFFLFSSRWHLSSGDVVDPCAFIPIGEWYGDSWEGEFFISLLIGGGGNGRRGDLSAGVG
jgi:hypothetical protein